ncbi:endo-1,4-beta-xylanase [Larkinella punicea]|uniref:Beta-xylanase n=1 Tax=Larkinella punicea TaxID=2315727 RepID=A0A368JMB6_9BACT|nr:endo-1,4-beta-xylanase [Larkinella punicea]RCR68797.1 endo-1,4-beta-xylanase [Larkinella punicea]
MRWFLLLSLLLTIWQLQPGSESPVQSKLTLKQAASFPLGASVNVMLLKTDSLYRNTVLREFNSITSENALKMNRIFKAPGVFDWSGGDSLVNFALKNHKRMHGHTLVWHRAIPKWIETFEGDSLAWENLLKNYIQTVVKHYKGRVTSWDVANEVIDDDGSLRKSIWLTHLGPDYVARCYQYAHEADPNALLFYNDYGQENNPLKSAAIRTLLVDCKRREIPIHGIGLQSHISIYHSDRRYRSGISEMSSLGLLVHISELDIRLNRNKTKDFVPTKSMLEQQEDKYKSIARIYKEIVPKSQQYGITIWNVGDKDSYQSDACKCPEAPLLFDKNYKKKLAYKGFLNGLK